MSRKKGNKRSKDNEKTKRISTVGKEERKVKKLNKKSKHQALKIILRILIILIILCIIAGIGIAAAVYFGWLGDDFKITAADLNISMENSVLIDLNGNEIATLNGEQNREVILLSEMGEYLPKAFIAIEDKRFYEHQGVDIKRTLGAITHFIAGDSSYGGSTITQQLIKNATEDKEGSWKRKVREISRAFQIEREMSKNQILESYLNTIPLGGGEKNVYGVKVAANYYFNKEPANLTIAESAYIAGINHAPNTYNPFKETPNTEKINKRTKTVLNEMLDQGKITKEEYDASIAEVDTGLAFNQGSITSYNSLTQNEEAAIQQVAKEYAKEHGLDLTIARQKIQSSGYKIYITENRDIQKIVDDAYTNNTSWIKTKKVTRKDSEGNTSKVTVQLQSAIVIIDHKTGYVVASRGVLGEKTPWGTNRATQAGHQPGSSIKPLAVISPSLEEKLITAGTVVDDTPVSYGSYSPHNDSGGYYGLMNIRYILRVSRNIPEVKMMKKLTPSKSMDYLEAFGISTINREKDEGLALALGGVSNGISPLEMAGAYATLANNGVYIEPTFYIKVEDQNGNVVMKKEQETHRVISEQNAWIVQSLLTEPTGTGLTGSSGATGTGARISGMQTCGKTGTTDDSTVTWFCGFTPYYAASMYFGYDRLTDGKAGVGSGTVATRWGSIMKKVHVGLEGKSFTKPSGITTARICKDSGLLATENCEHDPRGSRAYTEYFVKGTAPSKSCTTHVKVTVCKDTGKLANEYCTNKEERIFITRENSANSTSWQHASDAQYMSPTENCTVHTKAPDKEKPQITLKGDATITLKVNEKFTDPGATANDDTDGDLTDKITKEIKKDGKVEKEINTSKEGTYTITYKVTDAAGNEGTKTRTVKIIKNSENEKPNNDDKKPDNGSDNNKNENTVNQNTVN